MELTAEKTEPRTLIRRFIAVIDHPICAWAILAASLLLTIIAWNLSNQYIEKRAHDRFTYRTLQAKERIEKRMLEYEQVLRGAVGLYVASADVSRDEWKTYVENCQLQRYFPGIQAMGVAIPVPRENRLAHEMEIRAEGFEDYRLFPESDQDRLTSITFIEPFDWRNQRAFGYDMYSEPVRRGAMDRSIDTGLPTVSGKITLKQETDDHIQNGFLYYLPIFNAGSNPQTVAERRESLRCFVFAAFRAEDLMREIVGSDTTDIKFEIFDCQGLAPENILFDSDSLLHLHVDNPRPRFSTNLSLHVRGRDWTLHFESQPGFVSAGEGMQSLIVAFGGLLVDVLLFIMIASIGRQKKRALTLAAEITHGLRESERLTRSILENASEAIVVVKQNGTIDEFNGAAELMFCCSSDRSIGMPFETFLSCNAWQSLLDDTQNQPSGGQGVLVKGLRQDGKSFPCRIAMGGVARDGEQYYIIIARDETVRLESEQRIAEINQQLIDASHKSGMAEVATGVLHNVGNILNSLNVASEVLLGKLGDHQLSKLRQTAVLLIEHQHELASFLGNDPRGKLFIPYFEQLSIKLIEDKDEMVEELNHLREHIQHIKQIVRAQQGHVSHQVLEREEHASALLDTAAKINLEKTEQFKIQIIREFSPSPMLNTDRHKILQILVNLIKNSQEALQKVEDRQRIIWLKTETIGENFVQMSVEDNGVGISPEAMSKVLQFGFTTKNDGHGFGLHSCLIAAKQIGGSLKVESDGAGCGARFRLLVPIHADPVPVANAELQSDVLGANAPDELFPTIKIPTVGITPDPIH